MRLFGAGLWMADVMHTVLGGVLGKGFPDFVLVGASLHPRKWADVLLTFSG